MVYPGYSLPVAEETRTDGEKQEADRTPYYRQLWFWVVVAIVGGIVFGLVAPTRR